MRRILTDGVAEGRAKRVFAMSAAATAPPQPCLVPKAGMLPALIPHAKALPAPALVGVAATLVLALGGDVLGQDVSATGRSIASGRDTIIEGHVYQGPTAAEVEGIIRRTVSDPDLASLVEAVARGAVIESNERIRRLSEQLDLHREALVRMFEDLGQRRA